MDWGCRPEAWPFSRSSVRFKAQALVEEGPLLHVRGRIFGNVESVLQQSSCPRKTSQNASSLGKLTEALFDKLLAWYTYICNFMGTGLGLNDIHSPRHDTFVRSVISCGIESGETKDERRLPFSLLEACWNRVPLLHRAINLESLYYRLSPVLYRNFVRFGDCDRNLCLVSGQDISLHVGWISSNAAEGDQVGIFPGSPFPFGIRECVNGMHHLIGDAWLEGVAEWQALGMSEESWKQYETVDARYKSLSRWWEGDLADPEDLDREDEIALATWESEALGDIILC